MKYNTDIPIYIQIIEKIKTDILSGKLLQGERLPSIQEMAVAMDVNQNTISRVYKECESLGIIETKRGIGSFVVDNQVLIDNLRSEKVRRITDTFMHDLQALGYSLPMILDLVKRTILLQATEEFTNECNFTGRFGKKILFYQASSRWCVFGNTGWINSRLIRAERVGQNDFFKNHCGIASCKFRRYSGVRAADRA